MPELSPEEMCKIMFGIDYAKLVAADPLWKDTFQKNLEPRAVPQEPSAEQSSDYVDRSSAQKSVTFPEPIQIPKIVEIKAWGDVLRAAFPWEKTLSVLDPILGCLKMNKHSIAIHRLEQDLLYLIAISINHRSQIFISFPSSPVSLGILTVIYFAHIAYSKAFIIWVRPKDNGQILRLRTTKAFNLVALEDTHCDLREKITCLPAYKISERYYGEQQRVFMVRSLSEAIELLKSYKNCSLVVLDDPSGHTYPSPSAFGHTAFELGAICQQQQIPMVGIVPPWSMKDIEYQENKNGQGIKLWPIDFFALCSYPVEPILFRNHIAHHPINESYLMLQRKRSTLKEAEVIIKTFSFETEDEEKIAELFLQTSDLLLDLGKHPNLRKVWVTGWEIWRHLSAPVLPFNHLWGKFLESLFNRLQLASNQCKESKSLILFKSLNSLAMRFYKLRSNPFMEIVKAENTATVVAVENAERANALEQFLIRSHRSLPIPKILPMSQIRGLGGEKLIVIGQPKACSRDILQTTFFWKIDVLLWSILSERAKNWWSNLEVDAREWHRKTWLELTQNTEVGCYSFSPQYTSVNVINIGKAKLSKSINLSLLEERFSRLTGTGLDAGLTEIIARNLDSYYLIEFEKGLKIRTSPGSEFLVLSSKQTQIITVRELTVETKVVLFDGMNRDQLFAQKAGLLDDTKVNYLYRVQLDAWREIVKKQVKSSSLKTVCRQIFSDTGLSISEETIQHNWMSGDNLLSLPREREHFFWFIPPLARSGFEDFWQQANELRIKRRQLGQIISTCAQEGWKNRKPDEIVFQYQQVFITVGELQEAMQILKVQCSPKLISHPPEFPFNCLFKE